MATHQDVVRRWRDVIEGTASGKHFLSSRNLVSTHHALYSYGDHFPLALPIRDDTFSVIGYLLNGDRYSVTTARHQSAVRDALENRAIPTVTVPFSALRAAGVEPESVLIVDTVPARWVPHREERYASVDDMPNHLRWRVGMFDGYPDVMVRPDGDGGYLVQYRRHLLGESVFEAWVEGRNGHRGRNARFLSGWDHIDATYFLSELPGWPDTVNEAYESLKPEAVLQAEAAGRQVLRQGDVFVIPTTLSARDLTAKGAVRTRMGKVFGTAHVATETAVLPDGTTLVRGILRHRPVGRRPDHRALKIADSKTWALASRNTVPLAGAFR